MTILQNGVDMNMDAPPRAVAGSRAVSRVEPEAGLNFHVARTLEDVIAAWEIVYQAYRQIDIIDPNPYRIHTAPQAVSPHVAVIGGKINGLTVSTLTAIMDSDAGLPLDRVYGSELRSLRNAGHKLMEVGLFADRRKQLSRSAEALLQLMRYAFFYGLSNGITDFVIGVHPRHARFYVRSFGFETVGAARTYPAVNNNPVTLLRGNLPHKIEQRQHPAIEYFIANPIALDYFNGRFAFSPDQVRDTRVAAYLRDRLMADNIARIA